MLNECIEIFKNHAQGNVDKLIADNYTPAEGTYIILEETSDGFKERDLIVVKQLPKSKELSLSQVELNKISHLDDACRLIDLNKSLDPKKVIHSNNYLSFWIKKESLKNGKLTQEIIDNYYSILQDPSEKYSKSRQDRELYALVEKKVGEVNKEKLDKIRSWVKENIFKLPYELEGKDYLKLFFVCEGVSFSVESERYLIPNIFNKNEYNIAMEDQIYGLPNENMGLNAKKPYLESKNRKYKVPMLVDTESILLRKKFFDYLWNIVCKGKYNIYLDIERNEIIPLDAISAPNREIKGYFLRIRKDKNEAAVVEMDFIGDYRPELSVEFEFKNILQLDTSRLDGIGYGKCYELSKLKEIINEVIFSKFLLTNLYRDAKEISCNYDSVLKENILLARNQLADWFLKGSQTNVAPLLEKVCKRMIRNSIEKGYGEKVQHQFNLYISLQDYLRGGETAMADVMKKVREEIREKINGKESDIQFESDEAYFYGVGQLIRYFLSLSKTGKKVHSWVNPFLMIKKDDILKEKIRGLFVKYNYDIEVKKSIRFDKLFSMVMSYVPEGQVDQDYIIAGYISNSLMYEKREAINNG